MQMRWTRAADEQSISPISPPAQVLTFIRSHPGLFDACSWYPDLTAEYAPQLTIPGFGEELEPVFQRAYQESVCKHQKLRDEKSVFGSSVTTSGLPPVSDEEWIFRDSAFSEYKPDHVAYAYFHSEMFGPPVSPFEEADHLFWLLSQSSSWLPDRIHEALIQGMRGGSMWHRPENKIQKPGRRTEPYLTPSMIQKRKRKFSDGPPWPKMTG